MSPPFPTIKCGNGAGITAQLLHCFQSYLFCFRISEANTSDFSDIFHYTAYFDKSQTYEFFRFTKWFFRGSKNACIFNQSMSLKHFSTEVRNCYIMGDHTGSPAFLLINIILRLPPQEVFQNRFFPPCGKKWFRTSVERRLSYADKIFCFC